MFSVALDKASSCADETSIDLFVRRVEAAMSVSLRLVAIGSDALSFPSEGSSTFPSFPCSLLDE